MKHGWGNGRFAKALKSARGKAISRIGRPNMVILENRGLVVVDRAMLVEVLAAFRALDDADVARERAASALMKLRRFR